MKEKQNDDESDGQNGNNVIAEYVEESKEFKKRNNQIKRKGEGREEQCWDMLQRFKSRLQQSRQTTTESSTDNGSNSDSNKKLSIRTKNSWLTHRMNCTGDDEIVLARDANIRNEEDWYDIYDPRNPINKRRREEK